MNEAAMHQDLLWLPLTPASTISPVAGPAKPGRRNLRSVKIVQKKSHVAANNKAAKPGRRNLRSAVKIVQKKSHVAANEKAGRCYFLNIICIIKNQ
jgi:hypothetical protein